MSVEGATAAPTDGRRRTDEGSQNDPYRFLSTRLVRELLAADVRAETAGEETAQLAGRVLGVVAEGLAQPGAALLDAGSLDVVASCGLNVEEQGLLRAEPTSGGAPLARRALEERRVLLLGSGSREPLLPSLREVNGDWTGLVLVPLCDRDQCAGILALASKESPLAAASLRSLAPAFRLVTLLLHPGRRADIGGADVAGPGLDSERLVVEIEELRTRLAEARDARRALEDEDSSSQAALRAEGESLRARVAEVEASLAAGGSEEEGRLAEVETECARLAKDLQGRAARIAELEEEAGLLADRLARAEADRQDADAAREAAEERARADPSAEEALREAICQPDGDEAEAEPELAATSIPDLDGDDVQLGAIAEAAAAAIADREETEDAAGPGDGAPELVVGDAPTVVPEERPERAREEASAALGLWHFDSDPATLAWAGELAERAGATLWTGEGDPPHTTRSMLVVNLFDDSVARAVELSQGAVQIDSLVYAADQETGQGFELGRVGWVRRPLEPNAALARIQSFVPGRLGGIVIVSAQLRELAGLRQALAEIDAAGSVACDARQAADLLEIVRRPDAVLIDLTLEGGQGLALARQLRETPETSDVPILFLLPETVQAEALRADAERACVLAPYGADDARRLVNGALAHVN